MKLLIYFILFAFLGVGQEVFWTSIFDFMRTKNPRLKGRSTLWMFPIYGCIIFIILFVRKFFSLYPWWYRGIIYAALIIAWEYVSGFMIREIVGVAPWDYSTNKTPDGVGRKKRYHLHGLICLEYVPVWYILGLLAELLYLFLETHLIL